MAAPPSIRTARESITSPALPLVILASHAEYREYASRGAPLAEARASLERHLERPQRNYTVPGYCRPCQSPVDFAVTASAATGSEAPTPPNWRETLVCPRCHLNNRLRAAVHLLTDVLHASRDSAIYMTEQVTPLYAHLAAHFSNVTGSEYLGAGIPPGTINSSGVRNESLTALTFAENSFDFVLSFEVLEHIPDYTQALGELARVLVPGGCLLATAPFNPGANDNQIRARVNPDGSIEHLLPPEYHGDPINEAGCLCFQVFGWSLLDQLRRTGFSEAFAASYWAPEYGYLGGNQTAFVARK